MRVVLLGVAWVAVLWSGVAVFLGHAGHAERQHIEAEAEATAGLLGQTLRRNFDVVTAQFDLLENREAMLARREAAAAAGIEQHLEWTARTGRFDIIQSASVNLAGFVTYSTLPGAEGLFVGDRDYIQAHVEGREPGIHLTTPLLGRASKRWSMQVTRPLRDASGVVVAVGLVAIDPVALAAKLAEHVNSAGRIGVVRRLEDGAMLIRSLRPEQNFDRPPSPDHPLAAAARAAASGVIHYDAALDGRAVVSAWQVPPGLPVLVAAVFDEQSELAALHHLKRVVLIGTGLLTIGIIMLTGALAAWLRALRDRARFAEAATQIAEAAAQQRRDILANLAHEIRTPLTGMLGFSELLAAARLPEEQSRQAATVLASGQVLLALLNDILDLAKLEAGQVTLERLAFQPATLLTDSVALLAPAAAAKCLRLATRLSPGMPDWVMGDPARLRQVVGNLLSNAVKFTEAGSVTLAASVAARQADGGWTLAIEVSDTGIGIAPEVLPRLFGLFEQAETGTARRFGGSGLGLAICRGLAEAMGGRISVQSAPGVGSRFRLDVPVGGATPPAAAAAVEANRAVLPARSLSVLVADDVAANVTLLHALLGSGGHRVVAATSGAAAIEAATAERFDIILMDLHMPEMDGLTAARHIRAGAATNRATPILALTASVAPEHAALAREAGMNACLIKPIDRASLLAAVAAHAAPVGVEA